MNGIQIMYSSSFINDTLGDSMGRFSVSYSDSFDVKLEPNANYTLAVDFFAIPPLPSTIPPPSKHMYVCVYIFLHNLLYIEIFINVHYSTCDSTKYVHMYMHMSALVYLNWY